jgi:hypothetical protein
MKIDNVDPAALGRVFLRSKRFGKDSTCRLVQVVRDYLRSYC